MRSALTYAFLCGCYLCNIACAEMSNSRVVECIAPANAGGGWDLTCRAVGRILSELELVSGTVRVTNMPGAGGGVAFVHTVTQRATDQSLIVAASSSTTLNLAQGLWGPLSERDVRWLGAVGAEYGAVAVRSDARWQHLGELVEEWRRNPAAIVVSGGSAVASQDHMKILLLADAAGIDAAKIRFVPFDGGGEAMSALLGGFVQLFSGDASEMISQLDAGNIRVLTVFAPERLGGRFAQVPTARESGFDVDWINWRGLYVPADVSQEAYTAWLDRITILGQSEAWQRAREQSRLEPFFLIGAEFEQFVYDQVVTFRDMAKEIGIIQ